MHQDWNLGISRVEDTSHCLVVGTEKNMTPGEMRTLHLSSNDNREQLRGSRHAREQPKIDAVPRGQELKPTLKIQAKFGIYADQMVLFAKTQEQINYAAQKGATWPNTLAA